MQLWSKLARPVLAGVMANRWGGGGDGDECFFNITCSFCVDITSRRTLGIRCDSSAGQECGRQMSRMIKGSFTLHIKEMQEVKSEGPANTS